MPVIGNLIQSPLSTRTLTGPGLLINQGSSGSRTLALGGWTWSANPAVSSHIPGNQALGNNSTPSLLAIPNTGQDYFYNAVTRFGYDTGGVTLLMAPANGVTELKNIDDPSTAMSIQFAVSSGGGSGSAYLYLEFNGRVLVNATGSQSYTLDLTPAQSGWILSNGGILKYRMYAMNNENSTNSIQVNILGANGLVATHIQY